MKKIVRIETATKSEREIAEMDDLVGTMKVHNGTNDPSAFMNVLAAALLDLHFARQQKQERKCA